MDCPGRIDIDGLVGTVVTFQLEAGSLTIEQQHALVAEDAQIDLEGLIRRYGAGSGDRTDGAVGPSPVHDDFPGDERIHSGQ